MYRLLAIAALVLSFGISSAEAAKRVALVIGNWKYKKSSGYDKLVSVKNDVFKMSELLKTIGFKVIQFTNRKRSDLSREVHVAFQTIQFSPLLVY